MRKAGRYCKNELCGEHYVVRVYGMIPASRLCPSCRKANRRGMFDGALIGGIGAALLRLILEVLLKK